ncbi:hypothetical protein GCM10011574_45950 [Microbispora bryophytorum]|uniref:DUF305 domain-containing protein n=1 Tax=Microbispora bryophytorum TaxID=1460882 RepID=A0A8H9H6W4_9ACTN|nr:DUF305 domain-containing protein [Microbispora bryophytorum]GGO19954.1 hypothetical protein GCM10011574_45950 [Microbispora bryophytorum]
MTTTNRRLPAVPARVTAALPAALTGVLAMALLAGCGAPDLASGAASPAPVVASPAATFETPPASQAAPSSEATQTPDSALSATPDETGAPSAGGDAADVAFARQMVPHHLQALEMARLAQTRAGDPWVSGFAGKVATARDTDIRTFKGWLDMWGAEPLPRDHAMPGTQTRAEIEALAKLQGPSFDRKYVTLMIEHDNGAIKLARAEQADGAFEGAKALAVATTTSLGAEVKELKKYRALLD